MKDFEKKIVRLEQVAEKMREPDTSLETSFALFQEGVALARELKHELDDMQGKVEILLNSLEELDTGREAQPLAAPFDAARDGAKNSGSAEDGDA